MWHVETDYLHWQFFLIMFIKESPERARKRDRQGNAFFIVLLLSIVNVIIDIVSSLAMNQSTEWWMYEYAMTLYVASMPLLAAVWVCYEYVLIHRDAPQRMILRGIVAITLPYIIYVLLAITNPHTEWFFHLTSDMQYSRGALFMPVGVGFIMFYSAVGLLQALGHWKRIAPRSNAVLLILFLPPQPRSSGSSSPISAGSSSTRAMRSCMSGVTSRSRSSAAASSTARSTARTQSSRSLRKRRNPLRRQNRSSSRGCRTISAGR